MDLKLKSSDQHGGLETAAKSPTPAPAESGAVLPKKILVVEDERITQTLISVILKSAGYAVVAAKDAADALGMIRAEIPHLMTLDIDLSHDASGPVWDGFHVVEWLHHRRPDEVFPFIIISGCDPATIRAKAQSLGAFGYLSKPVDKHKLLAMVKEAIGEAPAGSLPSGAAPPPLPPGLRRPPAK
jgi:CheY-like chemotaxis protein